MKRVLELLVGVPVLLLIAVLLIPLLPGLAGYALFIRVRGARLARAFRREFASRGTPAILVYSESPHWQQYFEEHVFPRLENRAEVLNWSERRHWRSQGTLPIRVFQHFKPYREFNPYALVFNPSGPPVRIPFFKAFRDHKHGKPRELERALGSFWGALSEALEAWEA